MNYAIAVVLVLLLGVLTLVSYVDRLYSEIGKTILTPSSRTSSPASE